ncbi:hypothetical protein Tco_0815022 [Tanacetum coccineum]
MQQVHEQVQNQVSVYVPEGLILERQKAKEEMERLIAKAILQEHGNIQAQHRHKLRMSNCQSQSQTSSVPEQQYQLYLAMKVDPQLQQQDIAIWLALQMKFERNTVLQTACRTPAVRPRDQDNPHDDAHPKGENIPSIISQNDDDIEERTSRWVNKSVKKFNPYARYGVEHWKNPHAKIFYIRKQKEPGKPKVEIYLNSKIVQVIKTYWELGHKYKFITEIGCIEELKIASYQLPSPDYKNLNRPIFRTYTWKIMNGKIPDYADTRLLWSLSVFIRSPLIWERVHDFQLGIESYQQRAKDKLNYLAHPIPTAPVPAFAGQQVPPEALAAHAA